ncbi:MAG TPA: peptidoglycan DD-metalloendopeptidase family protein [Thermoanaerobaculia bacterium]|nr:peptidoglycan DD-metalloendopeptidase family protein [Thermoanaerobaculia bacterium]
MRNRIAFIGFVLALVMDSRSPAFAGAPVADSFRLPLDGNWIFARGFAQRYISDWCGFHLAEDANANPKDPVFAVANGNIELAEDIADIGGAIHISHTLQDGTVVVSVYYHLKRFGDGAPRHRVGEVVLKGDQIGEISGRAGDYGSAPHLHFGIRKGIYKRGIDPRTEKWFYPGYTGIYRNQKKQCNLGAAYPGYQEIVSDWVSPSQFVMDHDVPQDSWVRTNGPDLANTVFTAALVTTLPGELWASTNRGCFDRDALGVLRSTDRGLNWVSMNFGFLSTNVRTLMLTPNSDLFAGAHDGVYRLDRALGAWNPSGLGGVDVSVLRSTTRGLWAADSCFCTGVRQSTDNGQTWQRFNTGLPPCVNAIVQNPTTGDLYAGTGTSGVYRLPFGAISWSPVNEGLGSSDLHSLAVNTSGDLFAGTIQGLFRRENGAAQWTALTQGLPSDGIQSIAITSHGKMFIGTFSHGVYASLDNGDTWTEMNAGIPDVSRTVGAIVFDSQGFAYVSVGSIVYRSVASVE